MALEQRTIGTKVLKVTTGQVRQAVNKVLVEENKEKLSRSVMNNLVNNLIAMDRENNLFFKGQIEKHERKFV